MSNNRPIFSFIFATDLHFETNANHDVPEDNARIHCLLDDANKQDPDFVLFGGDITQRGSAQLNELIMAKETLDKLKVSYFLVAGNHDLAPNREVAAIYPGKEDYHNGQVETSNFYQVFGDKGIRFSFQKGNIQFIGISLRNDDPDGALDWLEQEISQTNLPKIIMTHYGIYPPRDSDSSLERWGFARIGSSIPRLRSIIEYQGSGVIAYLYGHNHINSMIKKNNILHISGGGIQKGCTGYWLFQCGENSIKASYNLLSDKSLHNFNYHGINNPDRCIDSTHKTVEEYHKGNQEEQSFEIFF
jgi:DNA repair exonuclease SbcCD nuclease subunit